MKLPVSIKHFQIDKANNMVTLVIAFATVISVFSLMSTKALLSQASYQRRVINEKHKAVDQLKENIKAAKSLSTQYEVFAKADPNIIGGIGSESSAGLSDGENPRIVLDALPNQYDFPALISSIEKILLNARITPQGIGGTDAGQDGASTPSANPQPIEMAFSVDATSTYANVQGLIKDLERSIRPIDITNVQFAGSFDTMNVTLLAKTYYQPGVSLIISDKVVK